MGRDTVKDFAKIGRTLGRKTLDNLGGPDQFRTKIVQTPNGPARVRTHGGLPRSYPMGAFGQQDAVPTPVKRYFAFYTSMTMTAEGSPVVADACRFDKAVLVKKEGSFGMYGNCTWHSASSTLTWHGIGRSDRHASSATQGSAGRRSGNTFHGIVWRDGKEIARLPSPPGLYGDRPCIVSAAMNGETLRVIALAELPWDSLRYGGEYYDKISTLALYEKSPESDVQLVRTVAFNAAMLQSCWFNQSGTKALGMMVAENDSQSGKVFELDFSTGAISMLADTSDRSSYYSTNYTTSTPTPAETGVSGVRFASSGFQKSFIKQVSVFAVDYKGDSPVWVVRLALSSLSIEHSYSVYEEIGFPPGFEAASAFNAASRASIGLTSPHVSSTVYGEIELHPDATRLLYREWTAQQSGQLSASTVGYLLSNVGNIESGYYYEVSSSNSKSYPDDPPSGKFGKRRGETQYIFDCEFVLTTEDYVVNGSWVSIPVYKYNYVAKPLDVKSPYPDDNYSNSSATLESYVGCDARFDKLFLVDQVGAVVEKKFSGSAPNITNPGAAYSGQLGPPFSMLYENRYVHASSSDGSLSVVTDKNQPTDDLLYLFRNGVVEAGANERLRHSDYLASPRLSPVFYRSYSQ